MALLVLTLQAGIAKAFIDELSKETKDIKSPKLTSSIADSLAKAYDSYAKSAMASSTTPTGGDASKISKALGDSDYMDGWEDGIKNYWLAVNFAGTGYVPANKTDTSGITECKKDVRGLFHDPAGTLAVKRDSDNKPVYESNTILEISKKLADVLDKHTKKVKVTLTTTSSPPTTSVVNIS